MATPITIIVLTRNEEHRLADCLEHLTWADDLLVVDSFSTDGTVELAQRYGARVIQHPFANFAAQHNFAQSQARHDWVLFVDADEEVTPELRAEIQALARANQLSPCSAYHIQRIHLMSGRWFFTDPARRRMTPQLRRFIRQSEQPRLLDRRLAYWRRPLHEEVVAPEPRGVLEGVIRHYANTNLSQALDSFNSYSDLEAAYLQKSGKRSTPLIAIGRAIRSFLYHFFFLRWFRYGQHGLMLATLNAIHKFLNYVKLWERQQIQAGRGEWQAVDRELLTRYQERLRE